MATHQHPRPVGPTTVNAANPFTQSMVEACRPERPRLFLAPRIPLPWCQTTHTPAPITNDMLAGYHPDTNRAFIAPKRGWIDSQTTHVPAPITVDMLTGWHPDTNRAFRPPKLGLSDSQTTHVPAPVSQEMLTGWHPDAPAKIFLGPKLGWGAMELTHVAAPLSQEMVTGVYPDAPRLMRFVRFGSSDGPQAIVLLVTPEMYLGWHPDRPVLGKPQPSGWTTSQTTHVQAPVTLDMLAGWLPPTARLPRNTKAGAIDLPQVTLLVMTPEMFAGWHPDRPVLGKPKPWGWTVSQTTHVPAAFMQAMVSATRPDAPNLHKPFPFGLTVSQLELLLATAPVGVSHVGTVTYRFAAPIAPTTTTVHPLTDRAVTQTSTRVVWVITTRSVEDL